MYGHTNTRPPATRLGLLWQHPVKRGREIRGGVSVEVRGPRAQEERQEGVTERGKVRRW